MNIEEAIDRGYDPQEDYTPHPMTRAEYLRWIAKYDLPDSGYGTDEWWAALPSCPF